MLNTKLNLYNPEWLELVFADRNKSYGAFELRQHYGLNMVKAMLIAFTIIVAASVTYTYAVGKAPGVIEPYIDVELRPLTPPPVKPDKKIEIPVEPAAAKPQPAAPSIKYTAFRVVPNDVPTDPPKMDELSNREIASVTTEGKGGQQQMVDPGPVDLGGTGVEPTSNDNKEYINVEVMPQPVGGLDAWSKFLNRNLRFPAAAQEAGIGGRVIVSFVIEKDGRLTDITVVRGVGYGMDEEALRVLKLAKPWKPGIQNGNPVRVRYSIPMNFQLSE
ncbi:energy transducer TonB [Mucilaginibacter aquariorum]|uniref:TonB family protein n=1 Tax=Mucilaginibacter aquariorum TaxID=2967225 RepID=A0ABT1SYU4_9SPHI|nr:energy transducer TonB [Mucilaginibacter aquariorum]MCQ6957427.1 TonB family protein [Mucilaginibacter aquariorum]